MALDGFPSGGDMPSGGGGMPSGGGGGYAGGDGGPTFFVGGGGDFPAGGVTGMGGAPGGQSATPQAARPNMANQVPAPLLNALIELLQKKVQQ